MITGVLRDWVCAALLICAASGCGPERPEGLVASQGLYPDRIVISWSMSSAVEGFNLPCARNGGFIHWSSLVEKERFCVESEEWGKVDCELVALGEEPGDWHYWVRSGNSSIDHLRDRMVIDYSDETEPVTGWIAHKLIGQLGAWTEDELSREQHRVWYRFEPTRDRSYQIMLRDGNDAESGLIGQVIVAAYDASMDSCFHCNNSPLFRIRTEPGAPGTNAVEYHHLRDEHIWLVFISQSAHIEQLDNDGMGTFSFLIEAL